MKKTKTAPFLGAIKFSWCDTCNLPILDNQQCDVCGNVSRRVPIAPPGDVRPAFKKDIERIGKIIDLRYGKGSAAELGLTGERLVLLNGASYDDLMDEIIIDGQVVGSIRYELFREDWEFFPRMIGAKRIYKEYLRPWKKYLIVDQNAVEIIASGYNVLAPGIIEIDEQLQKGEAAVALSPDGQVLSTGIMRIDAKELAHVKRGVVLKPKHFLKKMKEVKANTEAENQTWTRAVKANKRTLENFERRALASIKKTLRKHPDKPLSVSFSGGKDSLVCLQLARKLNDHKFNILFVNTGLEFPETITYVEELIDLMDLRDVYCKIDIPEEKFWSNVEKFGPPGKDFRFCCKILKIGPVNDLIEQCVSKKTLSLIGQRAYESIARAMSKSLWANPWIPNQLNFTPIQKWTALHIWLYIFKEELHYNPLYERGFSRIGCWLCPASNQGIFEIVKEVRPELWNKWEDFLKIWRKKYQLPKEWISWGLWRWKRLPKKIFDLATERGISLDYGKSLEKRCGDWELKFSITEGFAPCKFGGHSIEGSFESPLNLLAIKPFWAMFGKTNYSPNLGILRAVTNDGVSVTIFADGTLTVRGDDRKKIHAVLKKFVLEVFRAEECTGCQVCISRCPNNAITYNGARTRVDIDLNKCNQCQKCHNHCPVVKFGHPELEEILSAEN